MPYVPNKTSSPRQACSLRVQAKGLQRRALRCSAILPAGASPVVDGCRVSEGAPGAPTGVFLSPRDAKWPPKAGRSSTMAACCRLGSATEEMMVVMATRPLHGRKHKHKQPQPPQSTTARTRDKIAGLHTARAGGGGKGGYLGKCEQSAGRANAWTLPTPVSRRCRRASIGPCARRWGEETSAIHIRTSRAGPPGCLRASLRG
jgi:hypothetical protein